LTDLHKWGDSFATPVIRTFTPSGEFSGYALHLTFL
jgi:hypothetical protein